MRKKRQKRRMEPSNHFGVDHASGLHALQHHIEYDPPHSSSLIISCKMIYACIITKSTWWKKEWSMVARICNRALSTPKCPLYVLLCALLACSKHLLLQIPWEGNDLHKHQPLRVDAINKVVPLAVLVTIHPWSSHLVPHPIACE